MATFVPEEPTRKKFAGEFLGVRAEEFRDRYIAAIKKNGLLLEGAEPSDEQATAQLNDIFENLHGSMKDQYSLRKALEKSLESLENLNRQIEADWQALGPDRSSQQGPDLSPEKKQMTEDFMKDPNNKKLIVDCIKAIKEGCTLSGDPEPSDREALAILDNHLKKLVSGDDKIKNAQDLHQALEKDLGVLHGNIQKNKEWRRERREYEEQSGWIAITGNEKLPDQKNLAAALEQYRDPTWKPKTPENLEPGTASYTPVVQVATGRQEGRGVA